MSVFLSDIDDYLAPSQACVNPLFSTDKKNKNSKDNNGEEQQTTSTTTASNHHQVIVPRARHRRRPRQATATAAPPPTATITTTKLPQPSAASVNAATTATATAVKASIADCLACSGCITTAETVLLEEQHSLKALRERLFTTDGDSAGGGNAIVGLTLSPASCADLLRRLGVVDDHHHHHHHHHHNLQQQLTTLLCRRLQVHAVLDGNVPLHWSLQHAADEFCQAYQQQQQQQSHSSLPTNGLLNGNAVQNVEERNGGTIDKTQQLPMISSSCPALVCLAEKTLHKAVPHLSTVKSAMAVAGVFWKQQSEQLLEQLLEQHGQEPRVLFHLAVMPCHDKKLEASRPELGGVDHKNMMVITTDECFQLLQETVLKEKRVDDVDNQNNKNASMDIDNPPCNTTAGEKVNHGITANNAVDAVVDILRNELLSLPPAPVIVVPTTTTTTTTTTAGDNASTSIPDITSLQGSFITTTAAAAAAVAAATMSNGQGTTTTTTTDESFFSLSSGGYADFVFRYAAQEFFGVAIDPHVAVWRPATYSATTATSASALSVSVDQQPMQMQSARTAAAAQRRRRQLYQATLYREAVTGKLVGSWQKEEMMNGDADDKVEESNNHHTPVLRFVIAHGMQTMQRALEPFQNTENAQVKSNANVTSNSRTASTGSGGGGGDKAGEVFGFDYLEAMACPSGCINGGGQIRVNNRETPTQTRQRAAQTRKCFTTLTTAAQPSSARSSSTTLNVSSLSNGKQRLAWTMEQMHTSYRVVAPLQYQMGAAAGVAVKEIQW